MGDTRSEKFQEFSIVFDNPKAIYFPGQQLTGHVHIHTKRTIKTTGIHVRFVGSCYVSHSKSHCKSHNKLSRYKQHYDHMLRHENRDNWSRTASISYNTNDTEQRRYYRDTEVYFDLKEQLWGTDKAEKFGSGEFNLAFQLQLPGNLPTSYESDRGYVRYVVLATVSRSWNSPYRIIQPFTIISVVDLNNILGVEKPVSKHEVRKFGFLIFKGGSIATKIDIGKKGYVPGENIVMNGEICNNSVSRISKTLSCLVSVTTYRVSGHVFQNKQILSQIESVSIPSKSSWELKNIHLNIPPTPPSGLGGCGLLNVEYMAQVLLTTDMGSVEVNLPIVIGTIPLRTDFAAMQNTPKRRIPPPRPPPLAISLSTNANAAIASAPSELQLAANRRLAKEEEALGVYKGTPINTSEGPPTASFNLDLLTGDLACSNVVEDNTASLLEINQISSSAVSEMYPDLPPPTYEECMYGERVDLSDDEDERENSDGNGPKEVTGSASVEDKVATSDKVNKERKKRNTFAPCYVYYHQLQDNDKNT